MDERKLPTTRLSVDLVAIPADIKKWQVLDALHASCKRIAEELRLHARYYPYTSDLRDSARVEVVED